MNIYPQVYQVTTAFYGILCDIKHIKEGPRTKLHFTLAYFSNNRSDVVNLIAVTIISLLFHLFIVFFFLAKVKM